MPDPLAPPSFVSIPVELNACVPAGTVILVAVGDKVERIIARHAVEIEAFVDGAVTLKVLRMDPSVFLPSIPGLLGARP